MQVSAPPPRSGDIAIPYLEGTGPIYTSAGITAGIDLSLALVEEDHGHDTALKSARFLVMFLVRPGGQAQYSHTLSHQAVTSQPKRRSEAILADRVQSECAQKRILCVDD